MDKCQSSQSQICRRVTLNIWKGTKYRMPIYNHNSGCIIYNLNIWKGTNHRNPKYMPSYMEGYKSSDAQIHEYDCVCTSTSLHPRRHNLCLHLYFITPNEAQFVRAPLLHYTQRGTICACTSTSLHPTRHRHNRRGLRSVLLI